MIKNPPKVCVITPTYKRDKQLHRSIESVLDQTYNNIEYIIVDDASRDHTEEVVRSYNDSSLTYISHEINQGGSAARNTGIRHAEGKYLAFLDSDDEWAPNKVQKQVNCLENLSNDWIAVYCDIKRSRSGVSAKVRKLLFDAYDDGVGAEGGAELIQHLLSLSFPIGAGSTLMIRNSIIDLLGGFDESFQRHQDWEFLIRLLQTGKLAYVDEELVELHGTGSPSPELIEEAKGRFFSKYSHLIAEYEKRGIPVRKLQRLELARLYFSEGDYLEGFRHFRRGLTLNHRLLISVFWGLLQGVRGMFVDA